MEASVLGLTSNDHPEVLLANTHIELLRLACADATDGRYEDAKWWADITTKGSGVDSYFETQIHGPLTWSDVDRVVVNWGYYAKTSPGKDPQVIENSSQEDAEELVKQLREFARAEGVFATAPDLALAIRGGEIDCGMATRAVAEIHGLDFVPLVWERFDLVLRRRSYFEPAAQKLFAFMREAEFVQRAAVLGGYDVADAGKVRLNR